jgi:hypothetical protein
MRLNLQSQLALGWIDEEDQVSGAELVLFTGNVPMQAIASKCAVCGEKGGAVLGLRRLHIPDGVRLSVHRCHLGCVDWGSELMEVLPVGYRAPAEASDAEH